MKHFIMEQMGMTMTRCKPCLRLGSLEAVSEMETMDRRFIGKLSEETHKGRCGRRRGRPACPDTEVSGHPVRTGHWDGPSELGLSHRGQHRASPPSCSLWARTWEEWGDRLWGSTGDRGPFSARASSEPQWQIFPETGGSMVCLWGGNIGGATHCLPPAPTPCSALC